MAAIFQSSPPSSEAPVVGVVADVCPELCEALAYQLLLRKSCEIEVGPDVDEVVADNVSTAAPASSSASAAGSVCRAPASVHLLRNVAVHDRGDDKMVALLDQTRDLSVAIFDEDCLQEITKKSGWKLTLLASEDKTILCGFIVSKVKNGSLSIAKIAVPAHFRGQGFGKRIMDEMMKAAKKQGDVFEVCLSSLPGAVTFYQRLGFKAFHDMKVTSQEDLVEGQVYMEKRLRRRK